jgi:xylulose-5-phosphate/fructose-6-phosphate phosphoketolase
MEDARAHAKAGASRWRFASSDADDKPDIILAACGTIPTIELLATASLLRDETPEMKVRFVNVNDIFRLARADQHPHGMSDDEFVELFTEDRPVIFNFHGYASAIHQLIHRRPRQERFHVRGYAEEGTTTTPFELLAMNGVDRYQLAIEALSRVDLDAAEDVKGLSGAFAVRNITGAVDTIEKFQAKLAEHRAYVREEGNDPPEITNWTWSGNGRVS